MRTMRHAGFNPVARDFVFSTMVGTAVLTVATLYGFNPVARDFVFSTEYFKIIQWVWFILFQSFNPVARDFVFST